MKKLYGPPESSGLKYFGFLVAIALTFGLGWMLGINHNQEVKGMTTAQVENATGTKETVDLELFWKTWKELSEAYVDPNQMKTQDMVYGAIHGMVGSLEDPYTVFMTPEENQEFHDVLEGHLEGIGAELTLKDGMLTVISPLNGSPAQEAGLQPEDVIFMINDESTEEMTLEDAVKTIRGEKGTKVKLGILRESSPEPIDLEIVRREININSVEWEMQDGIAIIAINQFGDTTIAEFNNAVNAILNEQPKGVILDLRFNGGGYLDGAVAISSVFLENAKLVTMKKRNPEDDQLINTTGQAKLLNTPLVVLINKGSASASEIVAGAIQDHKRGAIVGEKSFGKGTVQEVRNLSDGASLRVTVAKWFTPNDQNINETGITPDVIVERTIEDFETDKDPQLDKALEILKNKEE